MANSLSGSDKPLYVMDDGFRGELGAPVGEVVTSYEGIASKLKSRKFLVTVGDIVTLDILELGLVPQISIVDYMTKRMPQEELRKRFSAHPQEEVFLKNPPGQITAGLWNAIKDGYDNPRHVRIVVEGEEDLAALACIALAPDSTTVIYGIPNRGASVHHVDESLKRLVKDVLNRMEA